MVMMAMSTNDQLIHDIIINTNIEDHESIIDRRLIFG